MTPYAGLLFFYLLALFLLPAVVLGLMGKPLRMYGLLCSAGMLAVVFAANGQLVFLVAYSLWQTGLAFLYRRLAARGSAPLPLFVALSLLPLALVKAGEVFAPLSALRLLGVSYMTFRALEVLLLLRDSKIKTLRLFDYSYFLLFFPSVASGPIDRWARFEGDLARRLTRDDYIPLLRRGLWKIAWGAFSAIVVSGLIQTCWLAPLPDGELGATILYMYGYTLFLFANFAGASSMAIGTAYLLGVELPENFRAPFLSVDMKDFWSRWHISLSAWLRDYVYNRFVMRCLKAKCFKKPRAAAYFGYAINMTLMGVWHGLSPRYLVYGAYHGLLLCVNEYLDLRWKAFRKLKQSGLGRLVCTVATVQLFSFGLLIFSGRLG